MQLIGLAIGNHLAVLLLKHLTKFEIPQKLRPGTLVKSIFLKTSEAQVLSERLKYISLLAYISIYTNFVITVKNNIIGDKHYVSKLLVEKKSFQIRFESPSNWLISWSFFINFLLVQNLVCFKIWWWFYKWHLILVFGSLNNHFFKSLPTAKQLSGWKLNILKAWNENKVY